MTVRIFQSFTVVFAVAAAYFWWSGNADFTFASVVLAICTFFISMRFQIKANSAIASSTLADDKAHSDPD